MPEVNHKDKNRANNNVENLEWCTRINNLYDSYETMSPIRNFRECSLYREYDNKFIKNFESIKAASIYSNENFGTSLSGMIKNHKSGGYYLKFETCND